MTISNALLRVGAEEISQQLVLSTLVHIDPTYADFLILL